MFNRVLNATLKPVACASIALIALAQCASASERREDDRPAARVYRSAYGDRPCIPATGAQVLGGFASPVDRLDPVTGEICGQTAYQ